MKNDIKAFNHSHEGQVLLTYELLFLLQWLMDYESESLKKIIVRSLKNGFTAQNFKNHEVLEMQINDPNIQQCVTEFLGLLDALLIEATTELTVQKTVERNLIPALNQIDSSICDDEMVENSLKKTNARINHHPEENPQEVLLKELLRRWKPDKKNIIN